MPRPDLCLFLDISMDAAARRGGFGVEKYETTGMQKRVRELFHELIKSHDGDDVKLIDAGQSMEEVEKNCAEQIERLFKGKTLMESLKIIPP